MGLFITDHVTVSKQPRTNSIHCSQLVITILFTVLSFASQILGTFYVEWEITDKQD
jgi:hypothetical protein